METLFKRANRYLSGMTLGDLAAVKFCVLAFGLLAGLRMPARLRRMAGAAAVGVFVTMYVSQMAKFLPVLLASGEEEA